MSRSLQLIGNKIKLLNSLHFIPVCKVRKSLSYQTISNDLQAYKTSDTQGLKQLIEAYEDYGHHVADINPLGPVKSHKRHELLPTSYGFSSLDDKVNLPGNYGIF